MYKQPRVPQMREGMSLAHYVRELILFLKDFTMDVWTENKRQREEIERIQKELESMRQEGG